MKIFKFAALTAAILSVSVSGSAFADLTSGGVSDPLGCTTCGGGGTIGGGINNAIDLVNKIKNQTFVAPGHKSASPSASHAVGNCGIGKKDFTFPLIGGGAGTSFEIKACSARQALLIAQDERDHAKSMVDTANSDVALAVALQNLADKQLRVDSISESLGVKGSSMEDQNAFHAKNLHQTNIELGEMMISMKRLGVPEHRTQKLGMTLTFAYEATKNKIPEAAVYKAYARIEYNSLLQFATKSRYSYSNVTVTGGVGGSASVATFSGTIPTDKAGLAKLVKKLKRGDDNLQYCKDTIWATSKFFVSPDESLNYCPPKKDSYVVEDFTQKVKDFGLGNI